MWGSVDCSITNLWTSLRLKCLTEHHFTLIRIVAIGFTLVGYCYLQVQGLVEHFRDSCGGVISWLDGITYYTSFTEGWALYAENPLIARETKVYDNEPFQKYGMLKWQVGVNFCSFAFIQSHFHSFVRWFLSHSLILFFFISYHYHYRYCYDLFIHLFIH